MKRKLPSIAIAAAIALAFGAPYAASGETLPFERLDDLRGPYEGVGAAGDAFYFVLLGHAGPLPICACWSSARTERSPLLGFGWRIPALESKFIPLDERRWIFHQPDGFARAFVRTEREDGTELTGGPAWNATIRGETIHVTADPGDGGPKAKFYFTHGRLVRMVCEEGEFDIGYTGRSATRITSRGKTLLEVVRKPDAENIITFRFNAGKSQTIAELRPAVAFAAAEDIGSASKVEETCLASLVLNDRSSVRFGYEGSDDEAVFKANSSVWKWNPRSRFISWHDGWQYMVAWPMNEWDEPAISRSKNGGPTESHHYDRKNGLRSERLPDGSLRECKMFTSGPLAWRRARWMKDTKPDGTYVRTDFAYDEAGRVFYRRTETGNDDNTTRRKDEVWFNSKGHPIRRRLNDEEAPLR